MTSPDAVPSLYSAIKLVTTPQERVSPSKRSKERWGLRDQILGIAEDILTTYGKDLPVMEGEKCSIRWSDPVRFALDESQQVELRLVQARGSYDNPRYLEHKDTVDTRLNVYKPGESMPFYHLIGVNKVTMTTQFSTGTVVQINTKIESYRDKVAKITEVREGLEMIREFRQLLEAQQTTPS